MKRLLKLFGILFCLLVVILGAVYTWAVQASDKRLAQTWPTSLDFMGPSSLFRTDPETGPLVWRKILLAFAKYGSLLAQTSPS